jgi:thioredoxin reductase (NADPH)
LSRTTAPASNASSSTRALFVFIGADPHTGWVKSRVALDRHGFVLTGSEAVAPAGGDAAMLVGRRPRLLETSCDGVFAVGDVRSGSIKRVAAAVGEGSMAIRMIHAHLARV